MALKIHLKCSGLFVGEVRDVVKAMDIFTALAQPHWAAIAEGRNL